MEAQVGIVRTIACDPLIVGEKYEVTYVRGITNEHLAEEVKSERIPGYYMGMIPGKGYPNNPRCICCHWASEMGCFEFLNPINGGVYRFCQKCLSKAVGFTRLNSEIWDIYEGYWRDGDCDEVEKKNIVSTLAGTLADLLRWFEMEPELVKDLEDKLVDHPKEQCAVIKPNN